MTYYGRDMARAATGNVEGVIAHDSALLYTQPLGLDAPGPRHAYTVLSRGQGPIV